MFCVIVGTEEFGAEVDVTFNEHLVSLLSSSQFLTTQSCLCLSKPSEHLCTASHQPHSKPILADKHDSQLVNEMQAAISII